METVNTNAIQPTETRSTKKGVAKLALLVGLILFGATACNPGGGGSALSSLVNVQNENVGPPCPANLPYLCELP